MKLRLNESQEELRNDKKEEGLSEDTAPRENLYGIELPISICNPFNADFDGDTMAILSCGNTIWSITGRDNILNQYFIWDQRLYIRKKWYSLS